nr:putative wd repeat-containing protein [Quercus suber]
MAKQLASSSLDTAPDTYFYIICGSGINNTDTLATISSDDTLRFLDSSLNIVNAVQSCHAGVSCLKHLSGNNFVTAGRDGLIKTWDKRAKQTSKLVEPNGRGISALATQSGNYFAVGTESTKEGLGDVSVLVFDTRNTSQPLRTYNESHTDSITQLAFHPEMSNVLLSASTDGLVSIFDVGQSDEDEALQQVLNPRSAVHCSGFLTKDQSYVLTMDEHFFIYPLAEETPEKPVVDFGDVRQNLDCMYVIDILQQPGSAYPPVMAYGHNENKTLSMIQLDGGPDAWSYGPRVDFPGAHGEEVVRDVMLSADQSRAFTCGEDGQVKVWSLEGAATGKGVSRDGPVKSARQRKGKPDRFAPY